MELTRLRTYGARAVAGCLVAAVCAAGVGLAGCSSNGGSSSNGSSSNNSSVVDSNGVAQVTVTLGDNNSVMLNTTSVPAGNVTFTITNQSASGIQECELLYNGRIIGEKENLAPGLDPVSFTESLDGGSYQIYTPGGNPEYTDFTVTGEQADQSNSSTSETLKKGVTDYANYVKLQGSEMKTAVKDLQDAVNSGGVDAAKKAYVEARPYYERMESAVDGFLLPGTTNVEDNTKNLDYLIDMRASNLDEKAGWHGFHAIERDLYKSGKITSSTKKYAKELYKNTSTLVDKVLPSFADDLKPSDLANGAADLLEEVETTKITGEEEAYSHIDLVDFKANLEGAQQAFECLKPGLQEVDSDLVTKIENEFKAADDALSELKDSSQQSGYKVWTEKLRKAESKKLKQAITPLHDDVSSLAEKVATA